MGEHNNYQNKNNIEKENETKIEKIKAFGKKHWKKGALTLALLLALGIGSCNYLNRENDEDKTPDEPKPPVEAQVPDKDNDVKKPEVVKPVEKEEESEKDIVDVPVVDEKEDDKDKEQGTTNTVVNPNNNKDKDKDKKPTTSTPTTPTTPNVENPEEGKEDVKKPEHVHTYGKLVSKHVYIGNGKDILEITETCIECGEVKTVKGIIEDCDCEYINSNILNEFWKCKKCGNIEKRDHNFKKIDDGEGTITYICENDGCDYSYIEEYEPEDNKNNNNNNGNGNNNNGGGNTENPGNPTDPDDPNKPVDPVDPDDPEQDRNDQTPGTGEGDGFVGGDEVKPIPDEDEEDEDYGYGYDSYNLESTAEQIEELNALKEELLQVQEETEVQYDYETNTLILSK